MDRFISSILNLFGATVVRSLHYVFSECYAHILKEFYVYVCIARTTRLRFLEILFDRLILWNSYT